MTSIYSAVRLTASKNPTHGQIIAQSTDRAEILRHWQPGEVVIVWTDHTPIKHWPQATLAKVRKTRLRKKLETKFPLFAEQFYSREIAARPGFFDGHRDTPRQQPE